MDPKTFFLSTTEKERRRRAMKYRDSWPGMGSLEKLKHMEKRKGIGAITIVLIGLGIGMFLKNVKAGLVIGLMLGLLAGGLLSKR